MYAIILIYKVDWKNWRNVINVASSSVRVLWAIRSKSGKRKPYRQSIVVPNISKDIFCSYLKLTLLQYLFIYILNVRSSLKVKPYVYFSLSLCELYSIAWKIRKPSSFWSSSFKPRQENFSRLVQPSLSVV